MAHPYKKHAQEKVGHARVQPMLKSAGYARGGKVNINIVVPKGDAPAGLAGAAGPPPPMAAPAPPMPMPPPGGPPPGGPPPGMPMPGGPPMRKHGGRVNKGKAYARGGGLPKAGADTGVGRLQKAKK